MNFFTAKRQIADIKRLRHILGVVFEAGGGIMLERVNLNYLVPLRMRVRKAFHATSVDQLLIQSPSGYALSEKVLRETLERLGPTFIKFGQVLSLRSDLVGERIANELSKLQSEVKPNPYEEICAVVRQELGKNPEELFAAFDPIPVAAASLSQVHRAMLADGSEVAVKIQRPGIRNMIASDIHILLSLAELMEKYIPETVHYQPVRIVKEFADWTERELDFAVEGHNADRFRFMYRDNPNVKIPEIHWDFTTPRVLTMEFIHGLRANDIKGMREMGIDPKTIATRGVDALLRQFLIEGFFHADPHPGNYFVLPDNVICFQDFGMVGYLSQDQRKELLSCFVAFTDRDADSYIKHVLHLSVTSQSSDVDGFRKDVQEVLNDFFYSPSPKSVAGSFFHVLTLSAARNVRYPADLALFGKALVTTESMGHILYPGFNLEEVLSPFVETVLKEYLNPMKELKGLKSDMFDYLGYARRLPEETVNLLDRIRKGDMGVKIDPANLMDIKEEFDRQNDVRILGLILTAIFIVTAALRYSEGRRSIVGIPLSTIGIVAFVGLFVWMILKVGQKPK